MQNSPARSSIDVGSVIADTYTIEALIGRGGMGAVFLASHKRLPGKQVAIKVLHAEMSGDEVLARFKREAEIASRLGHPNIVQVHDFNVMPDGTPYLVLEYLHGESLAQRLRNGPLALEPALSIVRQVGSALAAAHREGIVHRDLKPQNIFLVPTEVDGRIVEIAKVLDFGISKIRGSQTVKTQDSALLGTPQYMAPEQATGQHTLVDERTDVFAFGAIVYEMLSGKPAFSGDSIPEVVFKVVYEPSTPLGQLAASVPEAIAAAAHRAMAKKPDERFANVGELVEAMTGRPLAPLRPGPSIPPPDLGFAAGSRAPNTGRAPNTDKEAFAQTMGSMDQPAPALSGAPTVAPEAQGIATDRTVSAGGAAQVPSVAPMSAAPAKKKTGAIIAVALGAVVVAGAAAFVLTRGDKPETQTAHIGEPAVVDKPTPSVDKPPLPAPPEQAPTVENQPAPPNAPEHPPAPPSPPEHTSTPPKPPEHTPKPPEQATPAKPAPAKPAPSKPAPSTPAPDTGDDDADTGGDEVAAKKLADAQKALLAGDWDRAESLANAVGTNPDATLRQKQRAALVYGTVQCLGRNDEGRARIALRKLVGAPRMRRQLLNVCHRAQFLQNER